MSDKGKGTYNPFQNKLGTTVTFFIGQVNRNNFTFRQKPQNFQ